MDYGTILLLLLNSLMIISGMDIAHRYLDGNVDAVEFCPEDSYHHVLAASTYTLQEGDNPSRSGGISLFNVDADLDHLELLHHFESVGIFDIKWSPIGTGPMLAQADSAGYVRIHDLQSLSDNPDEKGICLTISLVNYTVA